MLKGEVLVRGDLILLEELAIEYVEMLDRISEIVTMEGPGAERLSMTCLPSRFFR